MGTRALTLSGTQEGVRRPILSWMDSSGLRPLIHARERLAPARAALALRRRPGYVDRVLEIFGLGLPPQLRRSTAHETGFFKLETLIRLARRGLDVRDHYHLLFVEPVARRAGEALRRRDRT